MGMPMTPPRRKIGVIVALWAEPVIADLAAVIIDLAAIVDGVRGRCGQTRRTLSEI